MAIAEQQPRLPEKYEGPPATEQAPPRNELADRWARLTTIATLAVLPVWPLAYVIIDSHWPDEAFLVKAFGATAVMVIARGILDVLFHRWIPWPNLFGDDVSTYKTSDARARRRAWTWKSGFRFTRAFLLSPMVFLLIFGIVGGVVYLWLRWASWVIDLVAGTAGYHPGATLMSSIGQSIVCGRPK